MPEDTPSPWADGDDPLPAETWRLVADIKRLAHARHKDALTHAWGCNCDGCVIRRSGKRIPAPRDKAA